MVIYCIVRHSPEVKVRVSFPSSYEALKFLKIFSFNENLDLSSDGWEAHDKNDPHNLVYDIQEALLSGVEDRY